MSTGLVIGKFIPVHKGHQFLIQTALANSDEVVVIVCDNPQYAIPADLRVAWLQELFPTCSVFAIPDIGRDEDSESWAKYTLAFLEEKGVDPPASVFTSEAYGEAYASYLGCKHHCVDQSRTSIPISGSAIMQNPLKSWEFLPFPVRAYFALRVCVLGAESTGTTTLSRALAQYYNTAWVPEFGRVYYEGKHHSQSEWQTHEYEFIAQTQDAMEDELARVCNKVLICDTDSFATELWYERYVGGVRKFSQRSGH